MEAIEKIRAFIAVSDGSGNGDGYGYGNGDGYGNGYGYGYGDGYGNGSGDGSGSGDGYGYGSGDGYGNGSGDGSGSGDGIKSINQEQVWVVDGVQTLIDKIRGNYAVGRILQSDLTLEPCYVVKVGNYFAHGKTLKDAQRDAEAKALENQPIEERIKLFKAKFPDYNVKVPCQDLFDWHHILTGSCLQGRLAWCKDHDIDLKGKYSVNEFINLTKSAYGGEVIKKL